MANTKSSCLPLYEKVFHKNTYHRALDVIILFLLLCLLFYRLSTLKNHGFAWFLAFLCESCFTFIWILIVNCKWTPLTYKTYPQRLQERIQELPPVDMFVTTADAELEPPIITVNTVLSLLAVDYPVHKLACYVSDDACSPLNFYSLVEASKFAKLWVPFCKKYNVQIRAPFRYFPDSEPSDSSSGELLQDWKNMKKEYDKLSQNIEHAAKRSSLFDLTGGMTVFSNTERMNHPTIVKVISENKGGLSDEIPHLVYISREKRPKHPHHYKAGAMNVLTRVSGLMTNAPFMLNVDCDMYANNPEIVLQAMCLHLGSKNKNEFAFIQSPQYFYDRPENLCILNEYIGKGIVGIQGPFYQGTGTFHRRDVVYGLCLDQIEHQGNIVEDELLKKFGNSKEFTKSAAQTLEGKTGGYSSNISRSLDEAHRVADCGYEYGSSWGDEVGCLYGATAEDNLTGLVIHSKGWRSGYCLPIPHAFLGCASPSGPAGMRQQKRWATGLLEILFSKRNPILATLIGKLQFRQCLAYLWILTWGLRSIPELCYIALPAYCIITNSTFLPKVQEPTVLIPLALFVIYKLYTLLEYIQAGLSIRSWWVNNCMARIVTTSAWLFGLVNAALEQFGFSEAVFEITQKIHRSSDVDEVMFDDSPFFVPGTTIILVHLAAWATGLLRLQSQGAHGSGLGDYFCSVYVVLCFFPFLRGLFMTGKKGIPWSTICKSTALALLFVQWCKMMSSVN
ncbi:hypothetical protein AB3S75_006527 [Citrus x aurantiifolia]